MTSVKKAAKETTILFAPFLSIRMLRDNGSVSPLECPKGLF